jgi:hypothetical protein
MIGKGVQEDFHLFQSFRQQLIEKQNLEYQFLLLSNRIKTS